MRLRSYAVLCRIDLAASGHHAGCLIARFRPPAIPPPVITLVVWSRDSDLRRFRLRSSRSLFDRAIQASGDSASGQSTHRWCRDQQRNSGLRRFRLRSSRWLFGRAIFRPPAIPPSGHHAGCLVARCQTSGDSASGHHAGCLVARSTSGNSASGHHALCDQAGAMTETLSDPVPSPVASFGHLWRAGHRPPPGHHCRRHRWGSSPASSSTSHPARRPRRATFPRPYRLG